MQIDQSQPLFFISTEVDRNTPWRQSVLRDSHGPPTETHAKWAKQLERDFLIIKHHLISQRENKIMGYTIVSGNKPSSVALHSSSDRLHCQSIIIKLTPDSGHDLPLSDDIFIFDPGVYKPKTEGCFIQLTCMHV